VADRPEIGVLSLSAGIKDLATNQAVRALELALRDVLRRIKADETIIDAASATASGGIPTTRAVNTIAPLSGGGTLASDLTLGVATFGSGNSGVVPASGGGTVNFLRADGTWAAASGGVPTSRTLTTTAPLRIDGGASADLSANRTLSVNTFGSAASGIVPASGGGSVNFLCADGTWATPGAGLVVTDYQFGTGYDGALHFDGVSTVAGIAPVGGVYTLTRVLNATSIVIDTGVVVDPDSYPLLCCGPITGTGKIATNGFAGSGSSGGVGRTSRLLPGSTAGGSGAINNSSTGSPGVTSANAPSYFSTADTGIVLNSPGAAGVAGGTGHGGSGGAGGDGGGGAAGRGGLVTTASWAGEFLHPQVLLDGRSTSGSAFTGASGGGGGGASLSLQGGGGGGGGGWVVVCAISCAVTIEAKGGNGAVNGSKTGGGGGGGGGVVFLTIASGVAPTIDVSGGTGGAASLGGGYNGGAGGAGLAIVEKYTTTTVTGVPTARTINTTLPLTGGGALSGDLTLGVNAFTSTTSGVVPSSGGGTTNFLRADGTWAAPPGGVPSARLINTTLPLTGGGDLSADRTLAINTFSSTASGIVPSSGGGTANFLRADGTWAAPPGGVASTRAINTTLPLTGGGDLSADRTLAINTFSSSASGVVPASGGGTSNFLRADGTWAASVAGQTWIARQILTAASGTYTPTSGTKRVLVRLVGGGGGGGGVTGASSSLAAGAGGASGGYVEKMVFNSGGITGGAYTTGAAGTGGSTAGGSGGTGGDTTVVVQGTTYTAKGGTGGSGMTAGTATGNSGGGGNQAGTGTGDVNRNSEPGQPGIRFNGGAGFGGNGGHSPFGAGGAGSTAAAAGGAASGKGAGGGGAMTFTTTAFAGGVGTAGVIIIDEFA
jgi:hypothetical protein